MSPIDFIKKHMPIRAYNGSLTARLIQEPAAYGLGRVPSSLKPDATVNSVCGFCSTGCSLKLHLKENEAVNLTPNTEYPVNLGMACPKGWESLSALEATDRAERPMLRMSDGKFTSVSWDKAMSSFVSRFKNIQEKYGNESIAFLSTGQIVTEEMAFLGALAKFGMNILHGDGNTRQCMATSVVAYKQSFGFDAPPYTYQDFEESDVLIFVGANPCIAHPIMWQRVMRNKRNPTIIVIDPRKTETAMAATQHLPIQPKSDLELFYGLASRIIDLEIFDQEYVDTHTNGFNEFKAFLQDYELKRASVASGISESTLNDLAELIASGKRVSFWWTMGVNQSYEGVRVAQSIINLALMTGNIGKPGTGANSITGQCNAMGSRLFSNTTNLFGGRDFTNPQHREEVANILNITTDQIPNQNSLSYHEIIDAIDSGKIKGLWLIATNSAHSWINRKRFRKIRDKLDYLVVQDMYHSTESAKIADLVLPAAGWGEKDGTFINSERRFGRTRKVRKAPGQALSDFNIFRLIAHHWGCQLLFKQWDTPENVFKTLKQLSKNMPCDFSGIRDYEHLDNEGGIQWPHPETENNIKHSQRRLFEDGQFYHQDKRAVFIFEPPRPMPEAPCKSFPFLLLTGRGTSAQWHTQTRTGKSDVLRKLYPKKPYVEIHPIDAKRLGIKPHGKVKVISRRSTVEISVAILASVQPGQIFIPMHYNVCNLLTADAFDPYSKQPSYKACAVDIRTKEMAPNHT